MSLFTCMREREGGIEGGRERGEREKERERYVEEVRPKPPPQQC